MSADKLLFLRSVWGTNKDVGGLRIFNVGDGSPADLAGLEVFFDYVVACDGFPFFGRPDDPKQALQKLAMALRESGDRPVKLQVFNTLLWDLKSATIQTHNGRLGATLGWSPGTLPDAEGLHVTEVARGSPAGTGGLVAEEDYLLGYYLLPEDFVQSDSPQARYPVMFFTSPKLLTTICHKHLDASLDFMVYSTATNKIRTVTITPSLSWGGEGCLGIVLGRGVVHELPLGRLRKPCKSGLVGSEDGPTDDFSEGTETKGENSKGVAEQILLEPPSALLRPPHETTHAEQARCMETSQDEAPVVLPSFVDDRHHETLTFREVPDECGTLEGHPRETTTRQKSVSTGSDHGEGALGQHTEDASVMKERGKDLTLPDTEVTIACINEPSISELHASKESSEALQSEEADGSLGVSRCLTIQDNAEQLNSLVKDLHILPWMGLLNLPRSPAAMIVTARGLSDASYVTSPVSIFECSGLGVPPLTAWTLFPVSTPPNVALRLLQ